MHVNECLHPFSAKKSELGIDGFGVSVTTMEEVFLRVRDGTAESIEHRYVLNNVLSLLLWLLSHCLIQWFWHLALLISDSVSDFRLHHTKTLVHQPSYFHSQHTTPASSSQHVESTLATSKKQIEQCLNRTLEHQKCIHVLVEVGLKLANPCIYQAPIQIVTLALFSGLSNSMPCWQRDSTQLCGCGQSPYSSCWYPSAQSW